MGSGTVPKMHEAIQMFVMLDYVRKVTEKKPGKYSKYGSFEHLLFLFTMKAGIERRSTAVEADDSPAGQPRLWIQRER